MTSINKFAGYGIAVAAALVAAIALLASTAYADVSAISVDDANPEVGDDIVITVDTTGAAEAVLLTLHPSSTGAIEFANGTGTIVVNTAGGTIDVPAEATEAGVVVVRAQQVDQDDDPILSVAITVGTAPSTVASLALSAPSALGDGDIDGASVRALDSDGDGISNIGINVVAGGAGFLLVAAGDTDGDPCVAEDHADVVGGTAVQVGECVATTASSPASALGRALFTIEADGSAGDEISILTFTGARSASTTITIGGVEAETVTVAASASETGGPIDTLTVTALDEDGNPVPDGTPISVGVSAGIASGCTTTTGGVATCDYTAPGVAQTVTAIATVAGASGSTTFQAGGAAPGETGFTGSIPASGVALVTFNGGTVAELAAAAQAAGVLSVSATQGGQFIVYIVGAPAFVNAAFNSTFPTGLAAGTPVILFVPAS